MNPLNQCTFQFRGWSSIKFFIMFWSHIYPVQLVHLVHSSVRGLDMFCIYIHTLVSSARIIGIRHLVPVPCPLVNSREKLLARLLKGREYNHTLVAKLSAQAVLGHP